jgi:protein-disulfide isomerase
MDKWSRVAVLLSVLSIAVSAFVWIRSDRQMAVLRSSQRELTSEVASMRRTPVIDVTQAHALGADGALVTLVEFSDYECPFCIRHFQQTWPQLKSAYVDTGKVRYVFRDFPVDQLHPASIRGHQAAHCAAEQNKYWELHNRLFSAPGTHTTEALEQRATEAGLDLAAYRSCVESGRTIDAIRKSAGEAIDLGASGTPAFFIGIRDRATNQVRVLQAVTGAQPFEVFSRAIDAVLAKQQGG